MAIPPSLIVISPNDEEEQYHLTSTPVRCGRHSEGNDICLAEIDPGRRTPAISRQHCYFQQDGVDEKYWYIVDGSWAQDKASTNGTFLRRQRQGQPDQELDLRQVRQRREQLKHGDRVFVPVRENDFEVGWVLQFIDWEVLRNLETEQFNQKIVRYCYKIVIPEDPLQDQLLAISGQQVIDLSRRLRRQVNLLLGGMARHQLQVLSQGLTPEASPSFSYEEMEAVIWGRKAWEHSRNELNGLIKEIRSEIRAANQTLGIADEFADPFELIKTHRGKGCWFNIECEQ